jgi:hypothetical protein
MDSGTRLKLCAFGFLFPLLFSTLFQLPVEPFVLANIIFGCIVALVIFFVTGGATKSKEKEIEGAKRFEKILDFDEAARIYDGLGMDDDLIRVRTLQAEMGAVKVAQKVVHGDEVTKTEIKDSVVSKSNIGSGGDDKFSKLKELKEMFDSGFISKEEMEEMKKEILEK